jgi:hypothetical protein
MVRSLVLATFLYRAGDFALYAQEELPGLLP